MQQAPQDDGAVAPKRIRLTQLYHCAAGLDCWRLLEAACLPREGESQAELIDLLRRRSGGVRVSTLLRTPTTLSASARMYGGSQVNIQAGGPALIDGAEYVRLRCEDVAAEPVGELTVRMSLVALMPAPWRPRPRVYEDGDPAHAVVDDQLVQEDRQQPCAGPTAGGSQATSSSAF